MMDAHAEPVRGNDDLGTPVGFAIAMLLTPKRVARFKGYVREVESGCHEWIGGISGGGYGGFSIVNRSFRAHRVAYVIAFGEIPAGMQVCHRCDNPRCVNPDHLWLGTHADNHRDKVEKLRSPIGSRSGTARLSEEQVAEIKALLAQGECQRIVAARFGVNHRTISAINTGRSWSHVHGVW